MPDPTVSALIIAFSAAIGLFVVAALIRRSQGSDPASHPEGTPPPLPPSIPLAPSPQAVAPYATPSSPLVPPVDTVIADTGVPTWPYRKIDFLGMALIAGLFAFLSISGAMMDQKQTTFSADVLLGSIAFHGVLTTITVMIVIFRINPITWLGLRWKNWPWVLLITPATVVGMWLVFGGLQAAGYMKWMESLGVDAMQDSVKLLQTATDPMVLVLMAVAAVLVAPISEEIVFRGYLYPAAKKFAGPWVAAICTGLIFGAAHGSLAALLPLFIFGVVLAVLYEKTGSIWAPMAVHFCFNGATVAIQLLVRQFPHLLDQAAK